MNEPWASTSRRRHSQEQPADVTSCSLENLFVQHFLLKPASQHRASCSQQRHVIPSHRRGGGGGRREHGRAPPRVNGFSPHWKTQLSQPGSLSRHHVTAGRHQKAPVTADHMVTWFYLWPCSHGCDHSIMFLTNISLVEGSSGTFSSIAVKLTCICHFIRYTW